MDIPRSTYYYQGKENNGKLPQEIFLKEKITQIAYHHPYYGYRRITAQLRREKLSINHKRVLKADARIGYSRSDKT